MIITDFRRGLNSVDWLAISQHDEKLMEISMVGEILILKRAQQDSNLQPTDS